MPSFEAAHEGALLIRGFRSGGDGTVPDAWLVSQAASLADDTVGPALQDAVELRAALDEATAGGTRCPFGNAWRDDGCREDLSGCGAWRRHVPSCTGSVTSESARAPEAGGPAASG